MLDKTNPVLKPYQHGKKSNLTAQELVDKIFGKGGIYDRIEKRWDAYEKHKAWRGEFLRTTKRGPEPTFKQEETGEDISGARALDPCPLINEALSELVGLSIDTYKEGVVKEFFEIAGRDPVIKTKLAKLPLVSAYSESEMEKHYARAALARIEKRDNGTVMMSEEAVAEIKQKAESRVAEYLSSTGKRYKMRRSDDEKMELAVPADTKDSDLAADIKRARKLCRLDETLKPFPYTHNYEHLAHGEKFLIENPAGHGNYPKSMQNMAQKIALPPNDPDGTSNAGKQIKAKNPQLFGVEDLHDKYMTFVGSGALPLTGFVNQIVTGCKVNLIDVDPEAVELSQKLRTHLEFLGVLDKDTVSVYIEHGNQVHYGGPRDDADRVTHRGQRFISNKPHYRYVGDKLTEREKEDVKYIPTDILYIASLIPNDIKKSIIRNLEENKLDPVPVAVVRSARGLSSMLYEPIHDGDKDIIGSSPHYHDYGSIVPKRHTIPYGNPHTAQDEGHASPVSITALLSDDNVNTAHIYYRSPLPMLNPQIVFLPDSSFDLKLQEELAQHGGTVDYGHLTRHGPALLRQMKQELERFAASKGIHVDTRFLEGKTVKDAKTSEELIEAYRQIGRQYTEATQGLSR